MKEIKSKERQAKEKLEEVQRKVHVSGLTPETTEEQLEAYFSAFGKVEDVLINCNRKTGKKKGFGFIRFGSKQAARGLISSTKTHCIG